MKPSILLIGVAMLGSTYLAYGEASQEPVQRPCFSVNIQSNPVNNATVQQNCDRNFNRTVQAGAQNTAVTVQSGQVNSNKVRQYWYDRMEYLDRIRGQ